MSRSRTNRALSLGLSLAFLAGASACGTDDASSTDVSAPSNSTDPTPTTLPEEPTSEAGERTPPPPLERFREEGDVDYPQPDLIGLSRDQVEHWAADSGLELGIFDSMDEVEIEAILDPNRLTVVIEDDRVVWSLVG